MWVVGRWVRVVAGARVGHVSPLQVGDFCDAMDQYKTWYESRVMETKGTSVKVGWRAGFREVAARGAGGTAELKGIG